MAKYYASEVAVQVSTDAIQAFEDMDIPKIFRLKSIIGTLNYVPLGKGIQKYKTGYFQRSFKTMTFQFFNETLKTFTNSSCLFKMRIQIKILIGLIATSILLSQLV